MPKPNIILVFDTETTGLLPKNRCAPLSEYPKILQLSFVLYDIEQRRVIQTYNEYIRVSDDTVIEQFITDLTGITAQICRVRGVPIENALAAFYDAYMSCDCVIAHNLTFDKKMLEIEIQRNFDKVAHIPSMPFVFNQTFNDVHGIESVCTMNLGKDQCDLWVENANGRKWKKNPKLSELHQHLFGNIPENLHDALADTVICLRCFLKMQFGISL
jgi:DNA polymerase-3 subunit epsilon